MIRNQAILSTSNGSSTAPSSTSTTTSAPPTWQRPRLGTQQGGSQSSRYGGGQSQSQQQNQNGAPTQTDLTAFAQALENAAALGVITTGEVAQYQSAANSATDAQLLQLTAQINELVASTPSAAASTIATTAAATTTTTSWWDGTTSLLGSQVNNSTLVIGGFGLAFFGWLAFGRKK